MSDHDDRQPIHEDRIASMMMEMAKLRQDVDELTAPDAAAKAIVPLGSGSGAELDRAEITKEQIAQVRAEAKRKILQIRTLSEELRKELEAQQSAARALMRPLEEQIKVLEEQSWTIDLYLGTKEEIVLLAEGDPAPASTPLTLRQEVLSMDEETAAFAAEGGIDFADLDVFDDWIRDPGNLARVLPEPKGVVVLVPRMRGKNYSGNPWEDAEKNAENRWSYWLIRNGERLWRMRTDFVVGEHMIPRTDEFTGLFVGTRRNYETGRNETYQLLPGTHEWEKAAEAQDARHRHYMRMALILQGLVDRTTVWHPLPEGGINLLDMRTYDEGTAVLVMDAENVLPDTAEPFYEWLSRLNNLLRPGMRIIGDFDTQEFKEAGDEYSEGSAGRYYYHANNRITPRAREAYYADKPASKTLHRLEGRKSSGFYFKFARTTERWMRNEWGREELRAPKTKGTCVVYPTDRFILPFDLVTIDEMRHYLASRTHRHAYQHMFPLLHAAIAAKEAEIAEEKPFRDRLAKALVEADPVLAHAVALDPELTAAHAALDPLVGWWKLGNKHHRALTGDNATENVALDAIVAEHLARTRDLGRAAKDSEQTAEAAIMERLLGLDPKPMIVVRKRDGGYLAFAPQPRAYGPRVGAQNLWLTEYTTTKTARTIKNREWVTAGNRADVLRTLYVDEERWSAWDKFTAPTEDLTDPEIAALTDGLVDRVIEEVRTGYERHHGWRANTKDDPIDVLPLGLVLDRKGREFEVWMTEAFSPEALDSAPLADTGDRRSMDLHFNEYHVDIAWSKTSKDGASLAPRDSWSLTTHRGGSYSGGGSSTRPWGYFWDGEERGGREITTYTDGQAYATERDRRIKAYRDAENVLHQPTQNALRLVGRGVKAVKERVAFEAFLVEYQDPDLWEGHKKTLRYGAFDTNFAGGRYFRGVPALLVKALDMLTDAGISHEGLTVRTAVEKAGLDPAAVESDFDERWNKTPIPGARFMDLPVWEETAPADTEESEEPEEILADEEADSTDEQFDEHGLRTTDDGIVIISGNDLVVGSVVESTDEPGPGNPPAVREEEGDEP